MPASFFMKKFLLGLLMLTGTISAWAESFESNGVRYEILDNGECQVVYMEYDGDVIIPETVVFNALSYRVTGIGEYAFAMRGGVTSVIIPASVKSIGRNAFQNCTSLTSISLPEGVTEIKEQTFYECISLTDCRMQGVVKIGNSAFAFCSVISTPAFNPDLQYIGDNAFINCRKIQNVVLPASTNLGDGVFQGCSALKTVEWPSGLMRIPDYTFYSCSSLSSIRNTDLVSAIGNYAFYSCSSLSSIETDILAELGENAFGLCGSLNLDQIYGKELTIGNYAFAGCSAIGKIKLNGVVEIGEEAFANIPGLMEVDFDTSMRNIRERAFRNCLNITEVVSQNPVPPFLANNSFPQEIYEKAVLLVPEKEILVYKQTAPWNLFWNVADSGIEVPEIPTQIFNIRAVDRNMVISGGEGLVRVFTSSGSIIFEGYKALADLHIVLDGKGIYIVTVNNTANKILIK